MHKILKIGHRGAKGYVAENTLASFQKAIELGCDGIELDVHLSLDKKVMVLHDESIDRTTAAKGLVKSTLSSELKKLNIPTLEEVLHLVNKKCFINIEIKDATATLEVLKLLQNYDVNLFQISSFNWNVLQEISELNPEIYLGILTDDDLENAVTFAKKINAKSINPYFKLLNLEQVTLLQKSGFDVFPWTVNDPSDIEKMKRFNVSGIISDFPDRI